MNRYSGKPFLRLLECYVLYSIGELDKQQISYLEKMESELENIYSMNGSWIEIVNSQMNFSDSLPLQINDVWKKCLEQSKKQRKIITPNEFAVEFVKQNFPEI